MTTVRGENGFTLVEVLVSVLAMSLLLTAGGLMLISAIDGGRLVEARTADLRRVQIARSHLSADIGHAVPRRVFEGTVGERPQSFYGGRANRDGTVLGLVRSGWEDIGDVQARSDLVAVEYRLRGGQLLRRVWLRPDRARRTPYFETILLKRVQGIRVRFYADGLPADSWDYVERGGLPFLPEAVSLEITLEDGRVSEQKFLVGRA